MANVNKNVLARRASGKFGNQVVFRQRAGETIMANPPGKRTREMTANQIQHQLNFKMAVIYANSAMKDPEKKAVYQAAAVNGRSGFNMAMSDFMRPPEVVEIDLSRFSGNGNDFIRARVLDAIKITGVEISIHKADGTLVESGPAEAEENGLDWVYAVPAANPGLTGGKVIATATDWPGHKGKHEKTI